MAEASRQAHTTYLAAGSQDPRQTATSWAEPWRGGSAWRDEKRRAMVARVRGTSGLRRGARCERGLGRAGNWATHARRHPTHAHTIPLMQTGPTRHLGARHQWPQLG